MASAGDDRALLRRDEANVDAVGDTLSEIKLRKLLKEHSVNIRTELQNQHVHLVEVMNASIDSKLDQHMAIVKENLAAVRADMIACDLHRVCRKNFTAKHANTRFYAGSRGARKPARART